MIDWLTSKFDDNRGEIYITNIAVIGDYLNIMVGDM